MWFLISLFACFPPQLEPIGESIGTGVAVGWASAVAARVEQPDSPACVSSQIPGTVLIDLDDPECAFPMGELTTGQVEAVGSFEGEAVLMALRFVDVDIDGGSLFSPGISAVTATRDDEEGSVGVVFTDQDVEGIQTGDIEVAQAVWVISVDLSSGPSGAVIQLDGGGQRATGAGDVVQLASVGTVMDASCRQNPIDGIVTMERADSKADVAITGVSFRETCDGQAKLEASLGLDAGNSQKDFPVDLWDRSGSSRR